MIGGEMPINTVFVGREPPGVLDNCIKQGLELPNDVITSRIMWLEGMEPGNNQGGYVDSHKRYIYIHGTREEDKIGTPASIGCIRMRNQDVIDLYNQVAIGTKVFIESGMADSNEINPEQFGFATRAVRAGQQRTNEGENSEPIFPTSSFVFDSAAEAAARFSGKQPGNIYSRFTNPTVRTFEQRLASMEGTERCVATASGMSAITATCIGLLQSGDHIVSSRSIFGTTTVLFENYLAKLGIDTTFVELPDLEAWKRAIKPETKLLFLETPSNPLTELVDIAALAEIAHARRCLLVVDNCFCTPALQQPVALGADIVIHSATKYIDGQGRCMGGAVCGTEKIVGDAVFGFLRTAGPTMSAFNAWVFLKGLETLKLRMQAHSAGALALAHWLEQQAIVKRVYYPGLESHPQHALAKQQQSGFGGIVSFELKGGKKAGWKLIDATRMISISANLGDAKSTITHPATTTHGRLTAKQRQAAGISNGLVRVAVGLEDIEDIKADLARGL
jgi:O-succinylhomoserine sulfhydrylase